ncbi:hypothetical protein ACFOHP_33135, partial [Couchioplanes caeruleus subsp. azureus]|uniref:hypothetical protein n=1 Tax=Couchioplanes caeruleus TaxID=56438 RepID=UPI003621D811
RPPPPPATPATPSAGAPSVPAPATPSAAPRPGTTPPRTPATTAPAGPAAGTSAPTRPSLPRSRTEQGPLWSDGSVRAGGDAARSEITLKLDEPVTALTITVRVRRTPGFSDQGAVHDVATARIDTQVIQEPDVVTFRFTLAAGATLGRGTHVFAAKYGHEDGGRDARDDTYRATATTAGGEQLTVSGDFS